MDIIGFPSAENCTFQASGHLRGPLVVQPPMNKAAWALSYIESCAVITTAVGAVPQRA
jgi:hypothetical protein